MLQNCNAMITRRARPQGAFGSVFVAMWKGQMVAVKVMKQAEGRKAMRMAWEMAVAQAVQHAHIITVREASAGHSSGQPHRPYHTPKCRPYRRPVVR